MVLIDEGRALKTLIPEYRTYFLYIVQCACGTCKSLMVKEQESEKIIVFFLIDNTLEF
jgi:cytochrome c oxidase assembly protein Cox11